MINKSQKSFSCRIDKWRPEKRYTPEEVISEFKLELKQVPTEEEKASTKPVVNNTDDVFTPSLKENQVIRKLIERGLYKRQLDSGKHDITCPWVSEHTDGLDDGAAYFEPNEEFPIGGFCCHHSHRDKYHIQELLDNLEIDRIAAQNKPIIRVVSGSLHLVVDAAEKVLVADGEYYQCGGLIVSIVIDPVMRDPTILATSVHALTKELSNVAIWMKYDGRKKDWVLCDPPPRHISILHDTKEYSLLPTLKGVARQPYFVESTGELVAQPGYNEMSQLFGVFNPEEFVMPEPTPDAARAALVLLEDLLKEFHFKTATDKAAALSAIFTAVVRSILDYAPGFHVRASVYGSGKTFLCTLIGCFAGPAENAKSSYPTTAEEAAKLILSSLLANPAVIEFDDMSSDWIPHGVMKQVFTATHITARILGVSKMATVSTSTLFLSSGNNVGPVRDLLRRVATIHIDARCETPATIAYKDNPVEKVRKDRGKYVAAVLTIIQAWRKDGSPRAEVENIVTFDGAWSDYCRHPLMWLGHPDPATALIEQVKHDPDAEILNELMIAWHDAFGSTYTTVRKVVERCESNKILFEALREFPVVEKGEINRSKFGWFLKKNANRIVGCYEFQKGTADGRTAWRVVYVSTPGLSTPVAPLGEICAKKEIKPTESGEPEALTETSRQEPESDY